MNNIEKRIYILKDCNVADDITGLEYHGSCDDLIFLVDYIDWNKIPKTSLMYYNDEFANMVLQRSEKYLMLFIIFRFCALKFVEQYINSKYMDMKLFIRFKDSIITEEFVEKYMSKEMAECRKNLHESKY